VGEKGHSEQDALQRIDRFMADVILPLAARTNAVILADAITPSCILSESFTRMFALHGAKWQGKPPFTIISCSSTLVKLYCSESSNWLTGDELNRKTGSSPWTYWQAARAACPEWYQNDKLLRVSADEWVARDFPDGKGHYKCDLDNNSQCYLLVDSVNEKTGKLNEKTPFGSLINAITHQLASTLPSIALKTGSSGKTVFERRVTESLSVAADVLQSGTPLLCIDPRPPLVVEDGTLGCLEATQAAYEKRCDRLLQEAEAADTFDTASLAIFGSVLDADGRKNQSSAYKGVPLHEAILRAEAAENGQEETLPSTPTSTSQVVATHESLSYTNNIDVLADWLARRFFADAHERIPEAALSQVFDWRGYKFQGKDCKKFFEVYGNELRTLTAHFSTILASPKCYHLNLHVDPEQATKLVKQIVRLDRLPEYTPAEGLRLLRDAWDDYDVTSCRASRCKFAAKLIFFSQLTLGWLVICAATLAQADLGSSVVSRSFWLGLAFALTIASSILLSLDGAMNAKAAWRQLRSCAGQLQSTIWLYRTRAGPFALISDQESRQPERALCASLNLWREDLAAGAELENSTLNREYRSSTYFHSQRKDCSCDTSAMQEDDHHSPMTASEYILRRVRPQIRFYQRRLPVYARRKTVGTILLLACTAASAVLSHYGLALYVIILTSFAAAVTSWAEFANLHRKMERYNRTIRTLRKLCSWWHSLAEFEKASTEAIAHLVVTAEAAISDERLSWGRTGRAAGGDTVPVAAEISVFDTNVTTKAGHRGQVAPERG
jgi:hypothetical protein